MRLVRFVVLWWAALFGWWVLVVGTNARLELLAGACAATIGAGVAVGLRRLGLLSFRFEPAWLGKAAKAPWLVVRDTGIVTWALALHVARVRRVRSAYGAVPFPTDGGDCVSAGRRALAALIDSLGPNTIPVSFDREHRVALRHELDPRRAPNTLP